MLSTPYMAVSKLHLAMAFIAAMLSGEATHNAGYHEQRV